MDDLRKLNLSVDQVTAIGLYIDLIEGICNQCKMFRNNSSEFSEHYHYTMAIASLSKAKSVFEGFNDWNKKQVEGELVCK